MILFISKNITLSVRAVCNYCCIDDVYNHNGYYHCNYCDIAVEFIDTSDVVVNAIINNTICTTTNVWRHKC